MFSSRSITIGMAMTAACLAFTACSSDNGTGTSDKATVRFVNATTGGTGSLGLTTNSGAQGSAVAYQNYGGCQTITPGSTNFSVASAGSSTVAGSLPNQTLTAGSRYTLLASGSAASPTLTLMNDTYTTPASGRARLRVFNATASLPFDVYVGTPGASLGTANASNVAVNSSPSFLDVPSGATAVNVTGVGTQTILGTSSSYTLGSGSVNTLVVTPSATLGGMYTSFIVPECQ